MNTPQNPQTPTKTQVVTINPDGSVEGLQRKPGQGLDLRVLGTADIRRVSEIEFNCTTQKWFVHVLLGRWAGAVLGTSHFMNHVKTIPEGGSADWDAGTVEFDDYDKAVAAEVAFLDAVRLKGQI